MWSVLLKAAVIAVMPGIKTATISVGTNCVNAARADVEPAAVGTDASVGAAARPAGGLSGGGKDERIAASAPALELRVEILNLLTLHYDK
jgi:hypothetical protein